ncbi:hypothetical protein [Rheinheimera maricola]|uniref:DUF3192 domain-containing protein n=1 Tax=Rheinheimera maricola TaxID=2793282 RepID=A0ABS7X6U2_9GAMM|nr:hypothetical protein [Rheinheimera maricola]MBZ9611046.1 hypothetical protein [Rheinheimera maricola]
MTICMAACQAKPSADDSSDYAVMGLAEAAVHTPYLAKIQHVNVALELAIDPKTQEEYARHIYIADVLTTYRGKHLAKISYVARTEKDDEALIDKTPVIVALCLDDFGQLYWPGTGSQFPVNAKTEMWLSNHQTTTLQQQSKNSWCQQ